MDQYFRSYEDLDTHQLMLNDNPRNLAYKNAIFNSQNQFQGKTVMDLGCGTGILSVFCAQVGASQIYAIEASELAHVAQEVFVENNIQDKVTLIHSKIEDVASDAVPKVDIIVSEWMGFYLVHEGMLDSVLFARDKFLKEDGIMFPSVAELYLSLCQLPSMYQFWDDIHGVSMRCVGQKYRKTKSLKPEILLIDKRDLLTDSKLIAWHDLKCVSPDEMDHFGSQSYVLVSNKMGRYQGICVWFSVRFPDGSELSTGPFDDPTHWKQTCIVLPNDIEVEKDEPIAFKFNMTKNPLNPRQYDMELTMLDADVVQHEIPCNCHMTKCIITKKYIEEHK